MGGKRLQAERRCVAEGGRAVSKDGARYRSQCEIIRFRRAYRALLAEGLTVQEAAERLDVPNRRIQEDLKAHPLSEEIPDVENLLTSMEVAAAVGITYAQLQKRQIRCHVTPAARYGRIFWYTRDAVERLRDGTERYEAVPIDRIGEVRRIGSNDLTRKIWLYEQGAPLDRVTWSMDRCVSPSVAEAECRVWRKLLDPVHYARLEQLLRFRVATWRARVKRNRECFEHSSAGSIGDCGERPRTRLKQAGSGILSRLRGVRITEGDE